MEALYRFTGQDIEQLKTAKEALKAIDCFNIPCSKCALFLGDRGCIVNHLCYVIRKAENEKGV